jgi:DHA1 family multidrug resistance protein-like MFS transporter
MGLNPILPLFIASIYKAKAMLSTVVGTAFAITGLTAALTVAYWGRRADRKGYRSSLFLTVGLTTLCLFSYPFARNLWHVYLIRLATGAAASGIAPILQSLIALNSVASRRGSIYGTVSVAHWAGNALGPLIAGYAARALGFGWAFAAMGFVGAASLAVAYGAIEEKMSPKSHHGKLENPEGVLAQ